MGEQKIYFPLLYAWIAFAPVVFILLTKVSAPYGRHARKGWGREINPKVGWVLMESPALCLVGLFYFTGDRTGTVVATVFLLIWLIHYVNRTLIYPFRFSGKAKPMPVSIPLFGFFFNLINGYFIGRYLFYLGPEYDPSWLFDPRFIVGLLIFVAGLFINNQSDAILRNLRKPGETGYKIPIGGLYRFISCPNYFGEILEWLGFAIATWSLPGLAFFIWSFSNLAPRALSHHKWYKERFYDYPAKRKAVIPYLF